MTTEEILSVLDNCHENLYNHFISLNHPYVYTIDGRVNIFRDDSGNWVIASEVLGYNPRGQGIELEITYFGNCLTNLPLHDGKPINNYSIFPVDLDQFGETVDIEYLKPDADYWMVRGVPVELSHVRNDYVNAGIELKEYEPGEINVEEAARLLILKHGDIFRATDEELYKPIPPNLKKILVLDEWYHKEFYLSWSPFDDPEILKKFDLESVYIQEMIKTEKEKNARQNREEWENNRPGSYETWQQIAKVIVTGDTSLYTPTLAPNSHWSNWPESGSM
jgi:hypothetical protein